MAKAQQLAEKLKQYIPNGDGYNSEFANDLAEAVEYLSQDEQEPVAWRVYYEPNQQYTIFQQYPGMLEHLDIQPLYTTPPKGGMMKPCIVIRDNKTTKLMEISKDGIWVNSEVPVNEVATAVLAAIEDQIKLMIELQTERQSARLAELETLNADLLKQLSNYQVSWESQEDLLELLYWDFDANKKKNPEDERISFKEKMRFFAGQVNQYANELIAALRTKRKPLSDEEIDAINKSINKYMALETGKLMFARVLARAIEKAHGIGD